MTGLLQLLALGYAVFIAALIAHTAWMLTHPHRKTYAWAIARGRPGDPSELPGPGRAFAAWSFQSRGRLFEVWDIPGDGGPGAPVVILSHGWADSRLGGLTRAPFLLPMASRLILWDLPGHGETPGVCTLGTREVEDLVALVSAVMGEHRLGNAQVDGTVMLYGWSLGAGVSIAAGKRLGAAISGVIAEAPYRTPVTPARNVMRGQHLPHRLNLAPALWLLGMAFGIGAKWRGFDRTRMAAELACPLLVIEGEADSVCPVEEASQIAAAATHGELVVVSGAGHNNLWSDAAHAEACAAAVARFISDCTARAGTPRGSERLASGASSETGAPRVH